MKAHYDVGGTCVVGFKSVQDARNSRNDDIRSWFGHGHRIVIAGSELELGKHPSGTAH